MPGCARPIAPYMRLEPKSRGQRRGIVRCDGRTREGRLLKETRKALLDHLGSGATVVQRSMVERIAWLELRCALFDQKQISGTFTDLDGKTYLALVGSLRRLYSALGIERPAPKFAELLKKRPKPEAAD